MTDITARNRGNKRRGALWETELLDGLRSAGMDAERLRLTGKEDEGDIVVREGDGLYLVIEAKSGAFQPGTFIGEAEVEAKHFAKHRNLSEDDVDKIVVVKRRGQSWRKAFVLTTVEDYFGLDLKT